jgi:hypothetical protein
MNFIRLHLIKSINKLSQDISETKSIIGFDDSIINGRYNLLGIRATGLPMIKDFRTGIFIGIDWDLITSSNLVEIYNVLKEKQYFIIQI